LEATFWEANGLLEKAIIAELAAYLDEHLNRIIETEVVYSSMDFHMNESIKQNELEDFIKVKRQPSLQQVLFQYIDQRAKSDADVYKKAGIDRKHFSKIRSNPGYRPGKNTIIALAFALELNKKETDKLLSSAGYSLSDSDTTDLIVQFFLEKKIYDIDYVNEALVYFSMKPLSGVVS
jgi:hypothetical protein